jgi:hypothetical protein
MKRIVSLATALALLLSLTIALPAQAAAATKYAITVKFSAVKMVSNKSVGNSWSHIVATSGKTLKTGKSYKLTKKSTESISITCKSTENDKIPDIGSTTITAKVSALKTGTTTYTKNVTVVENRGRYSGNKAVWKYTVTVTKAKVK